MEVTTLRCRCGWEGEPEATDPTDDETDIQCPLCASSMLMELADVDDGKE